MVDRVWTWRQNLVLERRLRYAKLRGNACVEDIDYRASRGLDHSLMRSLANEVGERLARWLLKAQDMARLEILPLTHESLAGGSVRGNLMRPRWRPWQQLSPAVFRYKLANRLLTLLPHVGESDSVSSLGCPNHCPDRIDDCVRV